LTRKCCSACAFRADSPERTDPYAWIQFVEGWADGGHFLCHETVPGHPQEKPGRKANQMCVGYLVTKHLPPERLMGFACVHHPAEIDS
jgi:hypothetical protein